MDLSIICPMYNEEEGVEHSIDKLRSALDSILGVKAEVLLINDGSKDKTRELALKRMGEDSRFRLFSHKKNFGRGRAIRTGLSEARGEVIITTEGDLSWGENIISDLYEALKRWPDVDAVFASPQEPGGAYKNVPMNRVLISRIGNRILRTLLDTNVSMYTGMTRAYRRSVIKGHYFFEDRKEIHLEIAQRLLTLNFKIKSIPAVLSWPEAKVGARNSRAKRTNWTSIGKLAKSHLLFAVLEGVGKLLIFVIPLLLLLVTFFASWAVKAYAFGEPSIFLVIISGILVTLMINLIVGYFLLYHLLQLRLDSWRVQYRENDPDTNRDYYRQDLMSDQ